MPMLSMPQVLLWHKIEADTNEKKLRKLMSLTSTTVQGAYLVALCADLVRPSSSGGGYVSTFGTKIHAKCDAIIKGVSMLLWLCNKRCGVCGAHVYIHIYRYMNMSMCVCVCVHVCSSLMRSRRR